MRNNYARFLVSFLLALSFIWTRDTSFAQNTSNKGKDFWVAYTGHIDGTTSRMTLFLSSDVSSSYRVEANGQLISSGTVQANVVTTVTINPQQFNVYVGTNNVREVNKGIHVTTGNPISLYAIISNSARTGGSMIIPTNTLGKEYYAMSYLNTGNATGGNPVQPVTAYSEFAVLAVQDNTQIEITPVRKSATNVVIKGTPFTVNLNKGDIYQYQAVEDLSGSYIRTLGNCQPVAVFSGNTWAAFCEDNSPRPGPASGGDNIYQQLFPVAAWGQNYITSPFYNTVNGSTDAYRIIVAEDNTTITVNGSLTSANNTPLANPYAKGSIITFFGRTPNVISANKPISVAHYQTSQNCNPSNPVNGGNNVPFPGDPEMTILNPIEQTLEDITVFSKLGSTGVPTQINTYYLNVVLKTSDVSTFRLNGQVPNAQFQAIPNSLYSYAIINVTSLQNQHRLTAAGGFIAIAYGYGSVESYAYLAGANVKVLGIEASSGITKLATTSGCVGEPINFKVSLAYQTTQITWDPDDGSTPVIQNYTGPDSTYVQNGRTIYVYKKAGQINYSQPGTYDITAIVLKQTADGCGNTEDIVYQLDVYNPPTAAFTPPAAVCATVEVQFTDQSNGNGRALKTWLWDFGDGTTSTEQNPKHTYTAGGDYTIKLTITNESNCSPVVVTRTMHINRLPVANFASTGPYCKDGTISFKDTSVPNEGAIVAWLWDFGDGTTSQDKDPTHRYAATGSYTVSLIVTTDKSCKNVAITRTVVINPIPLVDFITPEICLRDTRAQFTGNSTIADGSEGQFTYLWNFGDVNATPGNPNTSTQKSPSHNYLAAGVYQVSLTVTSKDGCSATLVKEFTVNGSVPVAAFTVQNASSLCSAVPVLVQDRATVDFGQLTKIEWYFDYPNKPTPDITDDDPAKRTDPARSYTFQYPVFHSPASRQVTIRMVAYSGTLCVDDELITVTLLAQPEVEFNALGNVCINVPAFQLTQAREMHGVLNGTGVYSGRGVIGSTFDPSAAGTGTHTITYTYTATNGCTDSESRDITVYPIPVADAGPDLVVLEGGEVRIDATASGSNLTYKWSPSTGLDRDDILTPVVKPINDITYTLVVTSDQGCTTMDNVLVKVLKAPDVPNTFTPNGDGLNDVWNIKYLDSYPDATVEVFNRYGVKVFASNRYSVPWDGTFQGNSLPVGTYYYVINPRNGRKVMSGSVTILR